MTRIGTFETRGGLGLVEWFRPGEHERVEQALADLRALGVKHLRTGISWADWFSPEGKSWYEWLVPRLAEWVEILPCFLYTPPSLGLVPKTSSPPRDLKAYADFLDIFITDFGRFFGWVELWNEPNNLTEWDWTLDPHYCKFCEMIGGAAYWAKQRGKKTVLGGMSPIDPHWLCAMFDRGVMSHIDAVGIHGFPDTFDYSWKGWGTNIAMVREVLEEHGSDAEIWITESGFSTWQHDQQEQIRQFLQAVDSPADRVYWYGIDDLDPLLPAVERFHLDEREYCFGMKKSDGTPKLLYRLWREGGFPLLRTMGRISRSKDPSREKAVLITGGAGFIGTNLADRLLEEGRRVIIYDNLSRPGVERNLLWLRERHGEQVDIRIASTLNAYELEKAVAEAGEVYHFAAQVAVTTSVAKPLEDFDVNSRGTLNLLEAVRKQHNPPPLVFTSTNKVYGAMENMKLRDNGLRHEPEEFLVRTHGVGESRPLDFHSPYGCSKGCADQYVLDYARTYRLPMIVFRMSCIYGPHQFGTEDQGWVAHFILQVLRNRGITLYGDGKQVRDILYVSDLVEALLLAQRQMDGLHGRAYNIGGGPANSVNLLELLELLRQVHGSLPEITYSGWRPGDQKYYVSDTRRFTNATGWMPKFPAKEGVTLLYRWLRDFHQLRGLPQPVRIYDVPSPSVAMEGA